VTVEINPELCDGCGICVNSCPTDVIRMDEESKKAIIKYLEECMLCELCSFHCPTKAIAVTPVKTAPLMVSWG
jgi:NAD-dependent dihydropyrimidine dehydrogenase PreA subunit